MRTHISQARNHNVGWTKSGPKYDPFIIIYDTPPNSPPRRGKNRVYNLPSQIIYSQPPKRTVNTGWKQTHPALKVPFKAPRKVNSGWAPAKKAWAPNQQYFRKQPERIPSTFKQIGFKKPYVPWNKPPAQVQKPNWWLKNPKQTTQFTPRSVKTRNLTNKFKNPTQTVKQMKNPTYSSQYMRSRSDYLESDFGTRTQDY